MEKRMMMSATTIAAWTFQNYAVSTTPNLSPAPNMGSGTAVTVGLQTGTTSTKNSVNPYLYPNLNASGTGDISDISAAANSDLPELGTTAWRIRGSNDGWSSNALVGTQGIQFNVSTLNYTGVSLAFDFDASSASALGQLQVQFTTDGTTWNNASSISTGTASNGATDGVSVINNTSVSTIVNGSYFQVNNNADGVLWQNNLTADFSGVAGATNNPNFGVRIVNATTGASSKEISGTAFPAAGSGNWRFDDIRILGTSFVPVAPSITASGNPTSVLTNGGNTVTFSAAATGSPTPTVQWQVSNNGGASYSNVSGATATTLSLTADVSLNGNLYRAVFSNSAGSATTTAATLTVPSAPTVYTQPKSQTIAVPNSVTFTATGFGPSVPTVTWQSSSGASFTNVTAGTSSYSSTTGVATYSFTPLLADTGKQFQAVFTSGAVSTATNVATLTVTAPPITAWTFPTSIAPVINAPNPLPQIGAGGIYPLGMTNDYDGYESVPVDDVTSTKSAADSAFSENLFRVRGGTGAGTTGSGGAPANGWNGFAPNETQGIQFNASTATYNNIVLHYDWYDTNNGVRQAQIQYTTDGGSTWVNYGSPLIGVGNDYYGAAAGSAPTGVTVNLQGLTGVSDNAGFALRMVSEYQQSTNPADTSTYLPKIYDGNLLITDGSGNPVYHGQYGSATLAANYSESEITIAGTNDTGYITITVPGYGTTAPINYDSSYTNGGFNSAMATNIQTALANLNASLAGVTVNALDGLARNYIINLPQNLNLTSSITVDGTHLTGGTDYANSTLGAGASVIYSGNIQPYFSDSSASGNWRFGNISLSGTSITGAPAILTDPQSTTVTIGSGGNPTVVLTASAYTESGLTGVQWQQSTDGGQTWQNVASGGTSYTNNSAGTAYTSTYTFTAASISQSGIEFQAVFTNTGGSATTTPATILVVTPTAPTFNLPTPAGNAQIVGTPTDTSAIAGKSAVLSATVWGLPFSSTSATWQISPTGAAGSWTTIPAGDVTTTVTNLATGYQTSNSVLTYPATLTINGYKIQVIFSNSVSTVTSPAVTLTVLNSEPAITQWNFGGNNSTGIQAAPYNTPAPNINLASGSIAAVGFTDPNFPSVPSADINNTASTLNGNFNENTFRIRGGIPGDPAANTGANGWDVLAPQYSQGLEIDLNTTNYSNLYLTFDWYQTAQGARDLQAQYCLDTTAATPTWVNINPLVVATNGGDFYGVATATSTPTGVLLDLSGVSGAANDPHLGIRLVSAYDPALPQVALTGAQKSEPLLPGSDPNALYGQYASATMVNGSPVPMNGTSGNWRFGDITIAGTVITPTWLTSTNGTSAFNWNQNTETLTVNGSGVTIINDPALSGDLPKVIVTTGGNLSVDSETNRGVHVASVSVTGGGIMTLNPTTTTDTLVVAAGSNTFAVSGAGSTFDLKNNFLDLQANASSAAATYALIKSLISFPTGPSGFTSSAGLGLLGAIGVVQNGSLYGTGGTISPTFGGVAPAQFDVLVRDTYLGDANLDGTVNSVDYTAIDNGFLAGGSGLNWSSGDFNGDGVVNGSDYTLIDNAFNTQGSQLSPAAQIARQISVFARGNAPISLPTTSVMDLLKKDQAGIISANPDVLDALNG